MAELEFDLVDQASFESIPEPVAPGARCQTCDYWELLDGGRERADEDEADAAARSARKRDRLLHGRRLAGSYGMLAFRTDTVERVPVGWAQFGPLSRYPRAQVIRDRYPQLPESPAPWVITCLQVPRSVTDDADRVRIGSALVSAVCDELDRRGVNAVEAYLETAREAWEPSPGPMAVYEVAGFAHAAGDEHFPVYRRELTGPADEATWGELLRAGQPADDAEWPAVPPARDADDFFTLPPERPKRPNPFGDD